MSEGLGEFNQLMKDAVAIKSAQLSKTRKVFDTWPQFHQAGLYYGDSFQDIRNSPMEAKIEAFTAKKEEGNALFSKQEYQKALYKYEEAMTVFRWVHSANPNWKNSGGGIEDSDLTVMQETDSVEATECMLTCYLNISLCNLKIAAWKEALLASEEALNIDPCNLKGIFRMVQALTLPPGSDLDDYKKAIAVLERAKEVYPDNKDIRVKSNELKTFVNDQHKKSKQTFTSFFKKPTNIEVEASTPPNAVEEASDLLKKGSLMVKDFKSRGLVNRAKKLHKTLTKVKKFKDSCKTSEETKKMEEEAKKLKEEALKYGLDLNDPKVLEEIRKYQAGERAEPEPPKNTMKWYVIGFMVFFFIYLFNIVRRWSADEWPH